MKEKLIDLIRKADKDDHDSQTQDEHYAYMANFLVANGATIPVQCKDCRWRKERGLCYMISGCGEGVGTGDDFFCSYGERKGNDI